MEVVRKDSVRSVKDNINQAEKEDTHIHQLAVNLALEVDRIHHNLPLVVIHILEEGFPYLEVELVVAFKIVEELKHLGFTLQTLSMQ